MDDITQTHKPHIYPDGHRVWYPNIYASYEEFQKQQVLDTILKRIKLMVEFFKLSDTWTIQQLLDKIRTIDDNTMYLTSNLSYIDYNNLFKDFHETSMQTQHLKQLIYFVQQTFITYPVSDEITNVQDILIEILKNIKADLDLKWLLITTCQKRPIHTLSYKQITTILDYFDLDTHDDIYDDKQKMFYV
jgi:hypothetical protein